MRMRFVPTPDNKYILVIDKVTEAVAGLWADDPTGDLRELKGPWEAVLVFVDEVEIDWVMKEKWVEVDGVRI